MTSSSISSYFVGVPGGLVMSMIAFSIVFIVIIGLILMMMGMKYLGAAVDSMGKKTEAPAASTPSAPSAPAQAVAVPAEDEGVLMAVISAAIMAVCGSAARVVSFRAVQAPVASSWKFVGRMQNVEGFQD